MRRHGGGCVRRVPQHAANAAQTVGGGGGAGAPSDGGRPHEGLPRGVQRRPLPDPSRRRLKEIYDA